MLGATAWVMASHGICGDTTLTAELPNQQHHTHPVSTWRILSNPFHPNHEPNKTDSDRPAEHPRTTRELHRHPSRPAFVYSQCATPTDQAGTKGQLVENAYRNAVCAREPPRCSAGLMLGMSSVAMANAAKVQRRGVQCRCSRMPLPHISCAVVTRYGKFRERRGDLGCCTCRYACAYGA